MLRVIPTPEDSEIRFELDEAVFVEPGAAIRTEANELIVEHADGQTTRHHGQWFEVLDRYGHTGTEVAHEVDGERTTAD